jgi:hypothetical protein
VDDTRFMTRTSRNRIVAWLGIAAMWLAIVAPVVGQTIAARAAGDTEILCSADSLESVEAHHHHEAQAESSGGASHHASAADHFEACSYCGLLAHNLPLLPGVSPAVARVERVARVARAERVSAVYAKSFNAAHSRAPPIVS